MSSEFVIRKYLQDAITGREIAEKPLNAQPHFVPLHLDIITKTLDDKLKIPSEMFLAELNIMLESKIRKRIYSNKGSLYNTASEHVTLVNVLNNTPALVYENGALQGILYANTNSFKALGKGFFTPILNKVLKKFLKGGASFDIGHTYIPDPSGLATTPSAIQMDNAISRLGDIDPKLLTPAQVDILNNLRTKLGSIKSDFQLHASYSKTVTATLSKDFSDSLLSVSANIVLIQQSKENRSWGSIEKKLIKDITNSLLTVHFSRNLLEEINYRLSAAIKGTKVPDTKISKKVQPIVSSGKKVPVTTSNASMPKIRNLKGQFYSLTSLQTLLNAHLQSVIAANMGDGSEKKILNYRTGRFAASAKVERLSQSRQGMITAWYSYMKNPYGTFEPGFAQGQIRSRDPKLLISKSIRDIAATKVGNQLRAISI